MAKMDTGSLESIRYVRGDKFEILDQLRVPHELIYREVRSVGDAEDAIKRMQVRGAPLIAMVGCLGIATELWGPTRTQLNNKDQLLAFVRDKVKVLIEARPTAVNMRIEGSRLVLFLQKEITDSARDVGEIIDRLLDWIEELVRVDTETNKAIGRYGMEAIIKDSKSDGRVRMLTHCNTGSLATSGYGTALGVTRALHSAQHLVGWWGTPFYAEHVYFTETRPYNQGSRLTAFELLHDNIPSTLICDSAVSWLMNKHNIEAVVVGADRVARNGDTANKIGTYQLAIAAKAHGVRFYVAAPFSSIDGTIGDGEGIVIEERGPEEVTHFGGKPISPSGVSVWNPAFDVTPATLITGIITEKGVFTPQQLPAQLSN